MSIGKLLRQIQQRLSHMRNFPWVLLLLIIVLVLIYWAYSVRSHRQDVAHDFDQGVNYALQLLQERFSLYENIILATRGLYLNSDEVKDDDWRNFIRSMKLLNNYPGVESIAFADFRARGNREFSDCLSRIDIDELTSKPVKPREISLIAVNVEPEFNQLLNYDFAVEKKTVMAMRESCMQEQAILSGVFADPFNGRKIVRQTLAVPHNDPISQPGYYHTGMGWIVVTFDATFWLDNIATALQNNNFTLSVAEVNGDIFFDTRENRADEPLYSKHINIPLGGHKWEATFYSSEDFERHRSNPILHLFPVTALFLTLLSLTVVRWLQTSRQHAMEHSLKVSRELHESETRYRELFEGNRAVELLIDPQDGSIIDANYAAASYYGYSRKKLRKMRISDINTLSEEEIAHEMERAREQKNDYFIFRHRLASGEVRDVEVHSGPVEVSGKTLLYSIIHDVTARIHSERALRESEERHSTIITTAGEGYWLLDLATYHILEVNDALCNMLGYSHRELIGRKPTEFIDEESAANFCKQVEQRASQKQRSYEVVMKHRDGHDVIVRINATNMPHGKEGAVQSFAFITDITEWKRSEEQLRIAATFFETTSEAIIVTNADNHIIAINPAFSRITGYSEDDVLGEDPKILSSGRNDKAFYHEMWQSLLHHGSWQGEIWNRRKNGEIYPEWLSIVVIHGDEGAEKQYMAVFSDITQRKKDEEKIWRQANYDTLTGLPNRNLFKDRLEQAMNAAQREYSSLALLFIDLDRFKSINDTLGHAIGDMLLQEAAARLTNTVRNTDTVARLGGDEFTVLLYDINSNSEIDRIAEKLLTKLSEPYSLEGREAFVSGSIGITLFPGDASSIEQLLSNADAAMYTAKSAGRNVFRYFTQAMNEAAQRRLMLETYLRRAMQNNELSLHYQPVHNRKGKVIGAEALLRWTHPELGPISPEEFIPLAEEIGIIIPIERWVLQQACKDAVDFQKSVPRKFYIAINISSLQCRNEQCHVMLQEALSESHIAPENITLEITERVMMESTETVMAILNEVKGMGVMLAVDDFGTGYSSLSYLKQFPIDVLKIDRAFISELPSDRDDVALVEAIVAMAHSLNLEVVAEGVETQQQYTFLQSLGCDQLQGFHFSEALPRQEFINYLKAHK